MVRAVSGPAAAVLSGPVVPFALLIEMQLTSTVRLNTSAVTINYGGFDWLATGALGAVEEVADGMGEFAPLKFTLSGVPSDVLAIALAEPVRNKACSLWLAVLDPDTHAVLDAPLIWTGTLDTMSVQQEGATSVVSVTAEHAGAGYARVKPLRYTDADQQRLYPGDTSLRFVVSQSQHQDVWPAASYWKK